MQSIFPEGACFTVTLYGLAWANSFPHLDASEREEALREMHYALDRQNDPVVLQPFSDTQVRNGVFWLGQRNLLLGGYLKALPVADRPVELVEEFHANSEQIAEATRAKPTHHLDSYPGMCWPIDSVTALRSIVLHDELYGTNYREVYELWKSWALEHGDPVTDMPPGKIDHLTGKWEEHARGCANSWMIPLLMEFDPDYGTKLYAQYRTQFAIDRFGFEMFREWPRGEKGHGADIDSGPIVLGAGVTATGVGLAAARSTGDIQMETDIRELSRTLGVPVTNKSNGVSSIHYLFGKVTVADAFLTWGYSIPRNDSARATPSIGSRIAKRWQWFGFLFLSIAFTIGETIYVSRKYYRKYCGKPGHSHDSEPSANA
ncbi:MAG: hypothetical protein ABI579_06925 [Candidatus Sumerlaeota bacterium]